MISLLSHANTLPFLRSLALTVISFQQFDDVLLNPYRAVRFREILADIRCTEADFIDLIGLGFSEDIKDMVNIQFSGLAHPLHLDSLREGGRTVFALHGFQEILLFLFGQIGKFHRRSECNFAVIHHLEDSGDQFRQADIS